MRLAIIAAGRFDSGPEKALYTHFAARFAPLAGRLGLDPLTLSEITAKARQSETQALQAAIPKGAVPIALDPAGENIASEAFAALIARRRDEGTPALAFLIGGADGLGPLRDKAASRLAFGAATWPHLLMRGMLAEQIYRAATILSHHPYHRG